MPQDAENDCGLRSQETADQKGADKLTYVQIVMIIFDESKILKFRMNRPRGCDIIEKFVMSAVTG